MLHRARPLIYALVPLLLAALYLLAWPVRVDPEAWEAPSAPVPTADRSLAAAHRVDLAGAEGPEDVDVDASGRVYGGVADGRILRFSADGRQETFADTGGRPLGLHWDEGGNLLVCDAWQGLLTIDPSGNVRPLVTEVGGTPLMFTDDLETAPDGTIWFTDATSRFRQPDWKLDLLENRPNGRLLAYDPTTGRARVYAGGLYFANGVAVDPEGRFVLVNETSRYRVRRFWIAGERAGQDEVLIDNLPGFPDGISTGTGGVFWIAVASPRNALVDRASALPWLRRVFVRLPTFLQPKPEHVAHVIGVDADGRVVHDLRDPAGSAIATVTSVQERNGRLYLGSLVDTAWAWIDVPRR